MAVAYSYIRWSTKAQGAEGKDSLRRQLAKATTYAERHGLVLDTTHRDEGVSSYHGAHRLKGALSSFLRSVQAGEIERGSFLLIDAFDRLGRESETQMLHLLTGITLAGVSIVTLNDDRVYDDKARPEELIAALISLSRAHEESVRKGQLVKAARSENKRKAREEGKVWHSTGPSWLKRDGNGWAPIKDRVALVQRIFSMIEEGHGTSAIAVRFNAEKIATPKHGQGWHHSTVLEIAKNRAVLGEYQPKLCVANNRATGRPHDGPPIPGYYLQIVGEDQFNRVQAIIANRQGRPRADNRNAFSNLFMGVTKCATCGGTVGIHVSTAGRTSVLRCGDAVRGRCENKTRYRYDRLEAAILATVTSFDPPSNLRDSEADSLVTAVARRDGLKSRLESLLASTADFGPTVIKWIGKQELEITEAEAEIERLRHVTRATKPLKDRQAAMAKLIGDLAAKDGQELYELRSSLNVALKAVVDRITFGTDPWGEAFFMVWVLGGALVYVFDREAKLTNTYDNATAIASDAELLREFSRGQPQRAAKIKEAAH